MTYDLVVYNGTVITVNASDEVIKNGIICIKEGRLEVVSHRENNAALPQAVDTIDAAGGIILPGLVNTHTHLPMTLFRGLADDLPLDVWLNEHIFPAEGQYIDAETVRCGTLLGIAELLLSGTTTCCDGYFYEEIVAEAIATAGLRAVVGQGVIDFPAPGVPDPSENVSFATNFINKWNNRHTRITPSAFCHSPYTCSPQTLEAAKQSAVDAGVLFQIHVAETQTEVEQSLAEYGVSPIAHLHRLGVMDGDTLLVHCIHLSEADMDLIAASGATVSHNPESSMKLAAGVAPVPGLLLAGVTVGLGTDGCASNNNLDLFGEMDTAAKLHKVISSDPTTLGARQVLKMATIEGARAIGLGDVTGSLEVGKQADLIIIDTHQPHLTPLYHPHSHLVYAARGSDVTHTIVAGNRVVADRRITTMDLETIINDVNKISRTIAASKKP